MLVSRCGLGAKKFRKKSLLRRENRHLLRKIGWLGVINFLGNLRVVFAGYMLHGGGEGKMAIFLAETRMSI